MQATSNLLHNLDEQNIKVQTANRMILALL